jgi:hypothetical protein
METCVNPLIPSCHHPKKKEKKEKQQAGTTEEQQGQHLLAGSGKEHNHGYDQVYGVNENEG